MLALVNCIFLYYENKGEDITKRMESVVGNKNIRYEYANQETDL